MSKHIEYYVTIKDGKKYFAENEELAFEQDISMFPDCLAILTLEPIGKGRSGQQNRYYFGVIINEFCKGSADAFGVPVATDEAHEYLKALHLQREETNRKTGEIFRFSGSTTELSTIEAEEYFIKCRQTILEIFNRTVPLPNEPPEITEENQF